MIDAHRGAFEYDWRSRFHKPLRVVGRSMSWGEALRLTVLLSRDPSSQIAAAVSGWENPVSREALVLMDSFNLAHQVASGKKQKPHPMYPKAKSSTEQRGRKQVLSQAEIIAVLRKAGHTAPLPEGIRDEVSRG